MRAFGKLLQKELVSLRWFIVALLVLTVVWHGFLYTKIAQWDAAIVFGLGFIPLSFIPLWLVIASIYSYRTEWSEDTSYFLLSLPVSGWTITVSKLLAVVSLCVIGLLLMVGSFFLFDLPDAFLTSLDSPFWGGLPGNWYVNDLIILCAIIIAAVFGTVMTMHIAYIFSRMANRFRGVVMLWILFIMGWFTIRASFLIEPLLKWLPEFEVESWNLINNQMTHNTEMVASAPFVAQAVVMIGLFAFATWAWQTQIEVA